MPIDLPNAELFKPALPRAPRLHGLFGSKNFRLHGFMEGDKWPPNALNEQYQHMVKMLDTHLHYKRLELRSDTRKKENKFQNLKEQCRSGRVRLKSALSGDKLIIRTLFSHNTTLQRLYSSMPLYAIVEHANDNTFRMRRKRDKLRYELQKTMDLYKQKLIEKSKLEDHIKFGKELKIPDEIDIINCRTEISTSQTRVYAFKAIQRAYKRWICILKKDENYYEPVLKSLEEDVIEQEKFIRLTIMLGYPVVMGKEKCLREEYQIATIGPKNEYVRETKSMEHMRQQKEDLERVMKELQIVTAAEKPKDIYPRFGARIHAFTLPIHRLDQIKEFQEQIEEEKNLQKEEEQQIANMGNILGIFQKSLYQMLDVLRHVDNPMEIIERKYPSPELKLPLLDFEAKPIKVLPPVYREDDAEQIMIRVLEKIGIISQRLPKDDLVNDLPNMLQQLRTKYTDIVEVEEVNKFDDLDKKEDELETRDYSNIPTRKQIKQQGMRIVEKALEQKELLGI
ncbi:uncharacterized protein LOC129609806 [Condylostylus longicornis]|uniref:uncharacterized protein LOC129609806 n=1 Tax=Condylostylus longicornis TaxID=2530218 RepID=UPI00244E5ABC|nr:uncharacterized protein LOC129609806 [Condylostylus longicornis]